MKKLTFDQFKDLMNGIDAPAQRLGIFNVKINNWHKRYYFTNLKINALNNPDLCGFGLNHYGWLGLPKQDYKQSKFHDEEDVSIYINRNEFEYAVKTENFNEVNIMMKTWHAQINW